MSTTDVDGCAAAERDVREQIEALVQRIGEERAAQQAVLLEGLCESCREKVARFLDEVRP